MVHVNKRMEDLRNIAIKYMDSDEELKSIIESKYSFYEDTFDPEKNMYSMILHTKIHNNKTQISFIFDKDDKITMPSIESLKKAL